MTKSTKLLLAIATFLVGYTALAAIIWFNVPMYSFGYYFFGITGGITLLLALGLGHGGWRLIVALGFIGAEIDRHDGLMQSVPQSRITQTLRSPTARKVAWACVGVSAIMTVIALMMP